MQTNSAFAPIGGHLGGPRRYMEPTPGGGLPSEASSPIEPATGSGRPMKPADVFPDLHHKMSKKIAQLTKVIYHLNTKNEDRQFELEEVNTNHQREMQDILSDAASKIKRFKEQLASKQGQLNMEAQMDKLRQAHAKEKKEALGEFRTFKRNAKAREESIQIDCKERTAELTALVEKEKKAFEESLRRFLEKETALKATLETTQKASAGNVSALKRKHQVELEEAVRKGNEKFSTMITEQLTVQEGIRRAADAEAKEARRVFEQSVGRLRAELAGDKETALSAVRRQSEEELKATRKSFTDKVERALADAARSRAVCLEEKERNASLEADRERLNEEIDKLRQNAEAMVVTSRLEEASLRRLLESAAAEGRRLTKALQQTEAARDEALAAGRGAGGEAAGLRETLRRERDVKEAFERGVKAEIASKDREIAARLGEIASLRQKLDGVLGDGRETVQKLERELAEAREEAGRASDRAAETEENLRVSIEEAKRAEGEGKKILDDLQKQLELSKQHAAAAQARLRSTMETELRDVRQTSSEAKAKAEKDLEAARQASEGGARELMERAKRREEELTRQLREEARRFEIARDAERASRAAEAKESSAARETLRQEAALERDRLQQAAERWRQEAEREKSGLRAQVEAFQKELDERRKAYDREKVKAVQSSGEAGRLARELNSVRAELQEARKAAVDRVGDERAAAQAEARAIENRAIRETQERLRRAAAEADLALAAEVGRVSEQLRSKHEAALGEAVKAERDAAEARHADVLRQAKALREQEEAQQEAERRELLATHKKLVEEAEAKGRTAASAIRAKAEEDKKAADERLRGELQAQASRNARELSDARSASMRERDAAVAAAVAAKASQFQAAKAIQDKANAALTAKLEGERDAERVALEKCKEQLREESEQLERARIDSAAARKETEAVRLAGEAESRNQRLATAAREAALVSKHATELSHAVGRQRDELREAQTRFGEKEQELSNRISALQQEQKRLEHRYENRPSREEDTRRIRKLEADATESRNAAAKAREEMAFFKRELLNREENYNKKFNANPVVGVMQVVRPKEIRQGSEGSSKSAGSETRFNPAQQQQQPRPPRYNKKTARSASLPSGYPGVGGGVVAMGTGSAGSRSGRTTEGGSVGSVVSSLSNGSSPKETSRAGGGRTWGGGTGAEGGRKRSERSR